MYKRVPVEYFEGLELPTLGEFIDIKFKEMTAIAEDDGLKKLSSQGVKDFQARNQELSDARAVFIEQTRKIKEGQENPFLNSIIPKHHNKNCSIWTTSFSGEHRACDCGVPSIAYTIGTKFRSGFHICEGGENCAAEGKYLAKVKGDPGTHEDGRKLLCVDCVSVATANGLLEEVMQQPAAKRQSKAPALAPEPKPREIRIIKQPGKRKFGLREE